MRFGLVHRVMTDALAVLGVLALVTSGKLNVWVSGGVVVALVLALALPDRWKQQGLMKLLGVAAPLLALVVQLGRLVVGADPIPIVVEFAAILQVIRLATRRGAIHDHQVILLSLLHLIAGTVLGGGLTYALSLIGFLVLTPGALVLSHLRREVEGNYRQGARDRTGMPVDVPRILRSRRVISRGFLAFTSVLSVPVFVFTAILFVLFPRVGFTWLVVPPIEPRRVVGFSDRVDLGGLGTIRTDPTLVMRVKPDDMGDEPRVRRNLYLRGAVFDTYDGRTWKRRRESGGALPDYGGTTVLRRAPRPHADRKMEIDLEPIQPQVVFVPGEAIALRVHGRGRGPLNFRSPISLGSHGELLYESSDQSGLKYTVFSPPRGLVMPERLAESEMGRYLSLPRALSPRISELSHELSRGQEDPVDIARSLEKALRVGYRYDLGSPSGGAKDPLDHFLFESKRGHCEFYSTAMAVMLRVRGVPSRNVTGFVGGTYNRFGEFYAVRQGDAHSWVEAYLPRLGWTRFDPTPPSSAAPQAATEGVVALLREMVEAMAQGWQQNVEGFDLNKQVGLFRQARSLLSDLFGSEDPEASGSPGQASARRRLIALGVLGIVAALAGYVWWRRHKARGVNPSQDAKLSQRRSIELYLKLEAALQARGLPRPPGTPPRTHAEALAEAGHPVGREVLELTDFYLDVRFGGRPLDLADERAFRARVAELRRGEDARGQTGPSV